MHVLILGARAPASLEWARIFAATGWRVTAGDSLAFPLTRFSNAVSNYIRLPEPRSNPNVWIEALRHHVCQRQIDLVLPTCEEAFYLAYGRKYLVSHCRVLVADLPIMDRLHHKGRFANMTRDWSIQAPETRLLETKESVSAFSAESVHWVFKPAYSRFATRTLVRPTPTQLASLHPDSSMQWVAQRFVEGEEYCSFSLLVEGSVTAHACYLPRYRAGRGAGIFFQPVDPQPIFSFVKEFGKQTGYTGQVGFDFIRQSDGSFNVIECNPRSTSGVHLFNSRPQDFIDALLTPRNETLRADGTPRMVGLGMLLFAAPKQIMFSSFRRNFVSARDVIVCRRDPCPFLAQFVGLAEIAIRALKFRRDLLSGSTADIEWDGQFTETPKVGHRPDA